MSNFTFLKPQFPDIYTAAYNAERHVHGDPRAACFYARYAVELMVDWLYDNDRDFHRPYDNNLAALLNDPSFRRHVPQPIQDKTHYIRKMGNQAVHSRQLIRPNTALGVVEELFHLCFWFARSYTTGDLEALPAEFSEKNIPPSRAQMKAQTGAQLKLLAEQYTAKREELLKEQAEKERLARENERLRAQLTAQEAAVAKTKAANLQVPVPHNYSEAETRERLIDVMLREAGWDPHGPNVAEYKVLPMPNKKGFGHADYVLWGDDGRPLAVVEAKRTSKDSVTGKLQARLYADALEQMHNRRPVIFFTNGYETHLWDDALYPPRSMQGFYTKGELEWLIQRRETAEDPTQVPVNREIVNRVYQLEAIARITERLRGRQRRGLLVMATGTGKTRTAIALVDVLMRAGWVKRVLFLADRTALVNQAIKAFKSHLPSANPINLTEDKDAQASRVVVSTYHTMMNQIEDTFEDGRRRFSVGHFDLIIIDEAHRSVYHKFGAIFEYFDAILIGLTATPKDEVDRNTYRLFNLEEGVPTFDYGLDEAVADGYLVPPRAVDVPLKFVREGIRYDDLSDDEKLEWELLEWDEEDGMPDEISSAAINRWLFNEDTVDKVLRTLMEHGIKVAGGDRLGKTIVFAKNQKHAQFIVERFDANNPELAGHFCARIDNGINYAQSEIENFSQPESDPHIAVSVDMLDTGIDVPEIVNLVMFKIVRSKTKFFQMLGRGTRLRPDLFGPGIDKDCFVIFDFCGNFEFFNQHPTGYTSGQVEPLSKRLFKRRLELLDLLRSSESGDFSSLADNIATQLHREVTGMPSDNFLVRPHGKYVDSFRQRSSWDHLTKSDYNNLARHVAGLPSDERLEESEEERRFDNLIVQLQTALLEGSGRVKALKESLIDLAFLLSKPELQRISEVKAVQGLLHLLQSEDFWDNPSLLKLEEIRLALRQLTKYIVKDQREPLYSDFTDELGEIREIEATYLTSIDIRQYRKKVEQFLRENLDAVAIFKIRWAMPLDETDMLALEDLLFSAGEVESRQKFEEVYKPIGSLTALIRRLVGLDRKAAKEKFAQFLDGQQYTAKQIRFVNYLIDQLTRSGIVEPGMLYEQPFTNIHQNGLDGLFSPEEADQLVSILNEINQTVF